MQRISGRSAWQWSRCTPAPVRGATPYLGPPGHDPGPRPRSAETVTGGILLVRRGWWRREIGEVPKGVVQAHQAPRVGSWDGRPEEPLTRPRPRGHRDRWRRRGGIGARLSWPTKIAPRAVMGRC